MSKRYILTIHGICTPGEWQENVQYVLEPHFQCVSIKYPHFRDRLAPLRLIFDLRFLCILAPAVLLLQLFRLLPHPGWWPEDAAEVPRRRAEPDGAAQLRARNELGWSPKMSFEDLIERMVDADLHALQAAAERT